MRSPFETSGPGDWLSMMRQEAPICLTATAPRGNRWSRASQHTLLSWIPGCLDADCVRDYLGPNGVQRYIHHENKRTERALFQGAPLGCRSCAMAESQSDHAPCGARAPPIDSNPAHEAARMETTRKTASGVSSLVYHERRVPQHVYVRRTIAAPAGTHDTTGAGRVQRVVGLFRPGVESPHDP